MSCGNPHETPCHDVLHSLVLYIDHEIDDQQQAQKIEIHFQECPPCNEEFQHEQSVMAKLKQLLTNSCDESAPQQLHQKIFDQTSVLAAEMQSQFFGMPSPFATQVTTQFTRHEITVAGMETRIEIETTEITHHYEVDEE